MATGCSTNAVAHLIAMARRAGHDLTLNDLDALGRVTPLIANVRPAGKDYLMEDFYYAGGLRALKKQIEDRLDTSCLTVTGRTLGENLEGAEVYNDDVIRPLSNPVYKEGSLAVLHGNLCPDGAVIKPAACDPRFYLHESPALVFDSYPEMKASVDDEDLDDTPDTVMVLRNAGPQGGPGRRSSGSTPAPRTRTRRSSKPGARRPGAERPPPLPGRATSPGSGIRSVSGAPLRPAASATPRAPGRCGSRRRRGCESRRAAAPSRWPGSAPPPPRGRGIRAPRSRR